MRSEAKSDSNFEGIESRVAVYLGEVRELRWLVADVGVVDKEEEEQTRRAAAPI